MTVDKGTLILLFLLSVSYATNADDGETMSSMPRKEESDDVDQKLTFLMGQFRSQCNQDLNDLKQVVLEQAARLDVQHNQIQEQQNQIAGLMEANDELLAHTKMLENRLFHLETSKEPEVTEKIMSNSNTGAELSEKERPPKLIRSDDANAWETIVNQLSNQMTHVTAEIDALKNADTQQEEARGSVYVRWGNDACPTSSEQLYSGLMGGSYYNQTGGAANFLCLPHDPQLPSVAVPGHSNMPGEIFGTEYQVYGSSYDLDAVCAVCRTGGASVVVIPAKSSCPAGWAAEYEGHIMGGSRAHAAATEFICLDSKLGFREGSSHSDDGATLYYAVTRCGSLPCPPYADNKIVPCVVCSK